LAILSSALDIQPHYKLEDWLESLLLLRGFDHIAVINAILPLYAAITTRFAAKPAQLASDLDKDIKVALLSTHKVSPLDCDFLKQNLSQLTLFEALQKKQPPSEGHQFIDFV